MAYAQRDSTQLHFDVHGPDDGPAVLAIAPGGMRSEASRWGAAPFDPRVGLPDHRVIAMDQRNAGRSRGPIEADHGWATHTADQLAVLDHLGIDEVSVIGMCIGGPYALRLVQAAPDRVRSAVLLQPIGLHENREAFHRMFDAWREEVAPAHPEADAARWQAYRSAMFGGDFLFGASRDDARACAAPVLLLRGDDLYHPGPVSDELAEILPTVTYVERWKHDDLREHTAQIIRSFLS